MQPYFSKLTVWLPLLLFWNAQPVSARRGCQLPCQNKGVCEKHSARRWMSTRWLQTPQEYCQCHAGYTGALCEIVYHVCSSDSEVCPNGDACERTVDDFGTEFFHCGCDMAKSDLSLPYASKFCEHASTVFCNKDTAGAGDANTKKRTNDPSKQSRSGSFCVNGGSCKQAQDGHHHAGCDCPSGYTGLHCEISNLPNNNKSNAASSLLQQQQGGGGRRYVMGILVFIGMMLGFACMGMIFLIHHGNRNRIPTKSDHSKGQTAEERARIPQNRRPVSEIELS